jgi:hypothetical protein
MGDHGQEPQHNLAFIQSTTLIPGPIVIDTNANESYKINSCNDINQAKMVAVKSKIKAIEWVDLYNLVQP